MMKCLMFIGQVIDLEYLQLADENKFGYGQLTEITEFNNLCEWGPIYNDIVSEKKLVTVFAK
jgi:hypothetical protein